MVDRSPEIHSEILTNEAGMSLSLVKTTSYPQVGGCLISFAVEHEFSRDVVFTTDINGSSNVCMH